MRRPIPLLVTAALAAAALVGVAAPPAAASAAPVPGDPLTGSGAVARSQLTAAQLTSGTASGTVPNDAFALPADAAAPLASFEGTLTLNGVASAGGFTKVRDTAGYTTEERKHLPPFSVQLVQNGSHLIPVARGLQITGSPVWNLEVGAGRAWTENGDGGRTRAALPFALVERNANCVHNGLLSFLFDQASVSQVRYQVTSETCEYFQFDLWGQVGATYTPGGVADGDVVRDAYAREVADRLPTKPISALATDHPGTGVNPSVFGSGITPSALSTFGFVYEGVNYVGDCPTRQGPYPYCGQLLLPSYSTAKSAYGGIGLMRLAQKYGPAIVDETLSSHLPEASGAAWNGVTIGNALDMATGNYNSTLFERDESSAVMLDFFDAEAYADKMSIALSFPRKATPGTKWNYHTSDTFLATRAMDDLLKDRAGSGADLFSMVRDEVFEPAGVGPDALTTVRTDNSPTGAPFGGYGLFWTQDDIAKVAKLLVADDGAVAGQQLLHPGLLDASLQRDPADRGLTTSGTTPFGYNNGYWALDFDSSDDPAYTSPFRVPFMSGFGGITVALMPNGSSYYVFSDNDEFAWAAAVKESNKLEPMVAGSGGGGGGGCTAADAIGNGGFETGAASPWSATPGVVDSGAAQPAHSGSWKALMNGVGDGGSLATLSQTVTIPAGCTNATLRLWLRVVTEEVLANDYDKLDLTVTPAGGGLAKRLARWTNQDAQDYQLESVPLGAYAGQTVTLTLTGDENLRRATWFVIDDVSLPVAG
ncbi:serine hydrolase [Agromyces soli]